MKKAKIKNVNPLLQQQGDSGSVKQEIDIIIDEIYNKSNFPLSEHVPNLFKLVQILSKNTEHSEKIIKMLKSVSR